MKWIYIQHTTQKKNKFLHIYDVFYFDRRWWWLSLFIFTSISLNLVVNVCFLYGVYGCVYMIEFFVYIIYICKYIWIKVVSPFKHTSIKKTYYKDYVAVIKKYLTKKKLK